MAREAQKAATRDALVGAAITLLSEKWLTEVSVADICRRAGKSNGVFYRYFSSREEIFLEILEIYFRELSEALARCEATTGRDGVLELVRTIFALTDGHRDLTLIYREGQYRYHDYERRINNLYERALTAILGRAPSAGEIIFMMAGVRFLSFRRTYHGLEVSAETVADLLVDGVFAESSVDWSAVLDLEARPLPMRLEPSTPERLITTGKEILGRAGFHGMNIYRLTESTGFGVGTFYNYFPGKEAFLVTVIETISHQLRQFISTNLRPGLNRLEQELQGMNLFTFYITHVDESCYNIVREAEFVTPDAVRTYYDDFAKGYAKSSRGFRTTDAWLTGNLLMGLSHYFGLAVLRDHVGQQATARKLLNELGALLQTGLGAMPAQTTANAAATTPAITPAAPDR